MHTLMVGIAETSVTPQKPVQLAGYSLCERISSGTHDDLYVRGLVMRRGSCVVAILSLPVVNFEGDFTRDIRKAVSNKTKISEQNILVHATHTHSTPNVEGRFRDVLIKKSTECLQKACENMFPAHIGTGTTEVSECGKNRRYLDYGGLPVDPEVGIIKIEDQEDNLRAIVFNYACHGTTLGAHNTLITEDWPYFAIQSIKKGTRNNVVGMFLNGAEGDINPGYSAGLSAIKADIPVRTWEEAQRIGERVGNRIVEALPGIATRDCIRLKNMTSYVDLPLRTSYPVTLEEAGKKVLEAKKQLKEKENRVKPNQKVIERAKVDVFFAELILRGAKNFYSGALGKSVKAELQTILLDDTVITTFPGEVFFDAGMAVKKGSPAIKTLIVGLANTYEARGYLPTRQAYDEGDYEVYESYYNQDAAEKLVEASLQAVREVWNA